MGKSQIAIVTDVVAVRWLQWFTQGLPPHRLIIRGGRTKLSRLLSHALSFLELLPNLVTMASFRAGGATELFTRGVEMARLRLLGRWKSLSSLDHYIQQAAAAMVSLSMPSYVISTIDFLLKHSRFLRRPPVQPAAAFFQWHPNPFEYG